MRDHSIRPQYFENNFKAGQEKLFKSESNDVVGLTEWGKRAKLFWYLIQYFRISGQLRPKALHWLLILCLC